MNLEEPRLHEKRAPALRAHQDPPSEEGSTMNIRFDITSFAFALVLALVLSLGELQHTVPAYANPGPCPDSLSAATPISPSLLAFTESTVGSSTTYGVATTNQSPSGNVPGVIELCVYHNGVVSGVAALYDAWTAATPTSTRTEFERPDGDPSNLPLDGSAVDVGQATYSTLPTSETIVVHINWAAQCPVGTNTCFKILSPKLQEAQPPTVSKNATGSYDNTHSWAITKSVDNNLVKTAGGASATVNYTVSVSHVGSQVNNVRVTGIITVNNPNSANVTLNSISDQLSDSTNCTATGGSLALPAGNTSFSYGCDLGGLPSGSLTNTATVSWSEQTLSDGSHLAAGSANFTTATISFTANEIDECASVSDTDPNGPQGALVCAGANPNPTTFSYSQAYADPAGTCTSHDNTSRFTTNDTGATGSASQTVTDCQGADLVVTKTATPSFKRTYNWNIQKSVDKTIVRQVGGSATFNYTVAVNETGFTDSNWQVNGTIHLVNPNNWEAITASVTDVANNGGSCTVTGGSNVSVPASGSVDLPYSCTYASAPSPSSGTNTATATWDANAYSTPNGSASGNAVFAFTAPTTRVNQTVTVSDSYAGTLGTLAGTDSTPFASATFTYSRTISVPQFGCQSYSNTATVVETGQSSGVTVTVCGPAQTGALTIGFWKTTNGQNLIKTYCQNPALANYLKGLGAGSGPFANAPTTSCNDVNTYAQTILNGASATDMNKMLKAQMMGTALDVWFTGPGWTSTKIGSIKPPSSFLQNNNLGSFKMDTTAVCPMVDNLSTGAATCLNNTPSTDAVAAGAVPFSPMKMQQILDFAATTTAQLFQGTYSGPFNGSTSSSNWYSSNRTKEEILKNIFDQFNNQLAFGSF